MPDMSSRLLLMSGRELRPCRTFCPAGFNKHKMPYKVNKNDQWYLPGISCKNVWQGLKMSGRAPKACRTFVRHARNNFRDHCRIWSILFGEIEISCRTFAIHGPSAAGSRGSWLLYALSAVFLKSWFNPCLLYMRPNFCEICWCTTYQKISMSSSWTMVHRWEKWSERSKVPLFGSTLYSFKWNGMFYLHTVEKSNHLDLTLVFFFQPKHLTIGWTV